MNAPTTPQTPDNPPHRKRSPLARFGILAAGWFFIVLGILGLFRPILQGILFLAIGAYLLSLELPWAQRAIEKSRRRYPRLSRIFDAAQVRAAQLVRRIRRKFR